METHLACPSESPQERQSEPPDFQRAMLNLLEDFDAEQRRLEIVQSATMNILDDFSKEPMRFEKMQTATLNILEDFDQERRRFAQVQTATLNILDDFESEKHRLVQSQSAFLNFMEDIDVEKGKLIRANQRVERVNAELEEFAYAASHDLKAPLRVIDNASKWIEEDLQGHLTGETRENMNLLRGRIARMEKLLDDMLAYSRIGKTANESFGDLIAGDVMMDNILTLLSIPEGFAVRVSPGFADIKVPRMPLQQILLNLVNNAIKHHDKKSGQVDVSVEVCKTYFTFAVKDDGPGIPAKFHELIFKMFQTLRPRDQVEGSGMGLAMVRKCVDVFGGVIEIESSEGKGSTFRVRWPKLQKIREDMYG